MRELLAVSVSCSSRTSEMAFYNGEMEDGLPHGTGTILYQDGSRYKGPFVRGVRQGHNGKFKGKDKTTYEGSWDAGKPHGTGMMWYASNFLALYFFLFAKWNSPKA